MDERTTLEVIAPTVEEALAKGLSQLGLTADAVSVEVLDTGGKGLFGLGGRQVRVRLTVNGPDKKPALEEPQDTPETVTEPVPIGAEPEKIAGADTSSEEKDQLIDLSEGAVSKLLALMNLKAQVSAHFGNTDREGRIPVDVEIRGDDLGVLIGRRSETLNAFQYIASLIVSKKLEQWVQLHVDVEGYRSRRERQLRRMAKRMAEQTIKTGRRHVLEPMPPNERRFIHLELRDHPGVRTESSGEEPHRKVAILPRED
ncbi:MAG: Jag N-terminal domain-containing protein [Anaerolineales bacterium]|nr:Jag N-terminal domain-containing protein [Anaerolineales bacterium]